MLEFKDNIRIFKKHIGNVLFFCVWIYKYNLAGIYREIFLHTNMPLMIAIFIVGKWAIAIREMGKMPFFDFAFFVPNGFFTYGAKQFSFCGGGICMNPVALLIKCKKHPLTPILYYSRHSTSMGAPSGGDFFKATMVTICTTKQATYKPATASV